MAKFIVPYNGELRIEAESAEEARAKAHNWRESMGQCMHAALSELNIEKFSIDPMRELTEVNDAWLENRRLRTKFREEWAYSTSLVPIFAGSKLCFTHRVAIRPVAKPNDTDDAQSEVDPGDKLH
jgi:hypothetical protein